MPAGPATEAGSGKCLRPQRAAARLDRRVFQRVAQFADVPRPRPRLEERERFGRQNARRVRDAELAEEVFGQRRDVVHAVAQRRQVDRVDVQAEEEVVPETALAHCGREVRVRRGDDPHIHRLRLARRRPG